LLRLLQILQSQSQVEMNLSPKDLSLLRFVARLME